MFSEVEQETIDIDKIKDEQNPMYQRVDIHRQRLISVLNRALEKLGIAYVLEELLTENINVVSNYITKGEIDSILREINYARHAEEAPGNLLSTVMKRSAFLKKSDFFNKSGGEMSSKYHMLPSATSMQTNMPFEYERSHENSLPSHLQRNYYSSLIAKLHNVPEIIYLAKTLLYKRPVKTIKYYVYLKDLMDHIIRLVYQTKTEEKNYNKSIKRAYVRNVTETDQVNAMNKNLQDRKRETREKAKQIKNDIENEKLIQEKMNSALLDSAIELIEISEENLIDKSIESHNLQEEKKVINAELQTCYNKELAENISGVQRLRKKVKKTEVNLKKILEEYDVTIGELNERYEELYDIYEKVETKYNALKVKFDLLEEEYVPLMAEKKHYMEMRLLQIRYTRATKIIQKWWRVILIKRWRWRKTFLANQIKRRDISKSQRSKILKNLKKLKSKQKRMNEKFSSKK